MLRCIFQASGKNQISFKYFDSIHNAIIRGLIDQGIPAERIIGHNAKPWNFSPIGRIDSRHIFRAKSLMVSTPDPVVAEALYSAPEGAFHAIDPGTGPITLENTVRTLDLDPFVDGVTSISAKMLSPLVIQDRNQPKHSHKTLDGFDFSDALSASLTRLAGRKIQIEAAPDPDYLRGREKYHAKVNIKYDAGRNLNRTVTGMLFPMRLSGETEDLRFAWHSGLGSKTRMGFGAFDIIA